MLRPALCSLLVAAPACLSATGGPPAESTSTTGDSTGLAASTGAAASSSSGDDDSSSGQGGSASLGETSSTGADPGETTDAGTTTTPPPSTSSSTDGPAPICGDGTVDFGEECDDANLEQDDECGLTCKRRRTVFISSEAFNPEFIGGLEGADSFCRQFALKMGSPHWKTFVAWLSDSKTSALDRIFQGMGRYARPDGVIVASSIEQFVSGKLLAPINITEMGELAEGFMVWTGTGPDGLAVPGAQHCDDWTNKSLLAKGHVGNGGASNSDWTYIAAPDVNPTSCGIKLRLYCFEGK